MAFEVREYDRSIGMLILRLFFGFVGIVGLVALVDGLVAWFGDRSAYASIWNALVGDEPYGRVGWRGVGFAGGALWRMTPNGLLPACHEISLSIVSLATAFFNRGWLYALAVMLMMLF